MQIPDTTICSLCRQKNRKGLEYLFQAYYKPLVVWADTFVNDIGGAEDLVQEFFYPCLGKRTVGRGESGHFKILFICKGEHGAVIELNCQDSRTKTGWDVTGIPRFLLIDENFNIISADAPRPSQKKAIEPLLEKLSRR